MEVENSCDDLWVGGKGQSNLVIAGSPRKIFRYRPGQLCDGGRALERLGVLPDYQTVPNSEYREQESPEAVHG